MSDLNEQNKELFKSEAYDLLAELETSLLELEHSPDDKELIGRLFRALHTIKGSGSMFGFDGITAFTHKVETLYERVRSGEVPVTKQLIDLTFSALDAIRDMLDSPGVRDISQGVAGNDIAGMIDGLLSHSYIAKGKEVSLKDEPVLKETGNGAEKNAIYRIRFSPHQDILKKGSNPLLLLNELRQLGRCEVVAITEAIPELKGMDPEACYTSWDIVLITDKGLNAIKDVFIFVEDDSDLRIDLIAEDIGILSETQYKRLGEILIERRDLNAEEIQNIAEEKKLIGEVLVEKGLVSNQKIQSALIEQHLVRDAIQRHQNTESAANIRVSSKKLDRLVDLVGELVTVQVRLSQTSSQTDNPELISISEEIERLTGEIRDNTMSIRMLPIGTTFSKIKRLVRDLSDELGKNVQLITEGAETELDKTMIERLNDPLIHIIRNSIDHGIEKPELRLSENKPKTGRIYLSAIHSGSHVLIRIRDDGQGLDPESIFATAVEKGIIPSDAKLSEKELFSLVLAPGFSTARQITNVSGRGVGLDVVRKTIEVLKGSVDIESQKGIGTTITLTLPLTLAIIEGLLVRISGEHFVIPLSNVEECVELTRGDIAKAHGRRVANIRGQFIPYIRLRERFMINGGTPDIEYIVITENDGIKVGLVVDHIIGEHQTVLKSLNRFYKNIKEISGATILGDGRVALVVDVHKLISEFERETTYRRPAFENTKEGSMNEPV